MAHRVRVRVRLGSGVGLCVVDIRVRVSVRQCCQVIEIQVIEIHIENTLYVICILLTFKMYFVFQLHFSV